MNKRFSQVVFFATVAILSTVGLYLSFVFAFWIFSEGKIYPGVKIAGIDLSGKTKSEAKKILEARFDQYRKGNLDFSQRRSVLVPISSLEAKCNLDEAVNLAYEAGRKDPFFLGKSKDIVIPCRFNFEKALNGIDQKPTLVQNSFLAKKGSDLVFYEGKKGKRLNYAEFVYRAQQSLGKLKFKVEVPEFEIGPTFEREDFEAQKIKILDKTNVSLWLEYQGTKIEVGSDTLVSWININKVGNSLAERFGDDYLFDAFKDKKDASFFSHYLICEYLEGLSQKINRPAQNARLGAKDGKTIVITSSKNGQALNVSQSANEILDLLEKGGPIQIAKLVIDEVRADINNDNLAELGLGDLLSVGYSNFTGSPPNRRHNIKIGASKFDGVLIRPNEIFSFIKTLGPVDARSGYLPELVIKENKTIPEYGGGMCQVSSTVFRAALNAGLPILERTAHSYPVSYYRPYGVDATVYIPKPDLVFKNDTGSNILIQTKIEGNKLTFEFYGTKPERVVRFAGNEKAIGAQDNVEKVSPLIYDVGLRGNGSFTAVFWRFVYDKSGKLLLTNKFVSKYDSPDKYLH